MLKVVVKKQWLNDFDKYTQPFIDSGIFIQSFRKRKEVMDILLSEDPSHFRRVWLVGFLKGLGCFDDEILALVDKYNCWSNYDKKITEYQVKSIKPRFRSHAQSEELFRELRGDISSLWDCDIAQPQVAGGEPMPKSEWYDVGEPIEYDCGWGKFIEVVKRTNGKSEGIVIANGEYGRDKEGNSDRTLKRYRNRLFFNDNNGAKEFLIKTLQDLK